MTIEQSQTSSVDSFGEENTKELEKEQERRIKIFNEDITQDVEGMPVEEVKKIEMRKKLLDTFLNNCHLIQQTALSIEEFAEIFHEVLVSQIVSKIASKQSFEIRQFRSILEDAIKSHLKMATSIAVDQTPYQVQERGERGKKITNELAEDYLAMRSVLHQNGVIKFGDPLPPLGAKDWEIIFSEFKDKVVDAGAVIYLKTGNPPAFLLRYPDLPSLQQLLTRFEGGVPSPKNTNTAPDQSEISLGERDIVQTRIETEKILSNLRTSPENDPPYFLQRELITRLSLGMGGRGMSPLEAVEHAQAEIMYLEQIDPNFTPLSTSVARTEDHHMPPSTHKTDAEKAFRRRLSSSSRTRFVKSYSDFRNILEKVVSLGEQGVSKALTRAEAVVASVWQSSNATTQDTESEAVTRLSDLEKYLILLCGRFDEPLSNADIGRLIGVTGEAVRQQVSASTRHRSSKVRKPPENSKGPKNKRGPNQN